MVLIHKHVGTIYKGDSSIILKFVCVQSFSKWTTIRFPWSRVCLFSWCKGNPRMPVLNRVWRNNILLDYIWKRKYEISPAGFQIFQCSQDTLSSCIAVTKRLYLKGSSPYERNLRRPRGRFIFYEAFVFPAPCLAPFWVSSGVWHSSQQELEFVSLRQVNPLQTFLLLSGS